MRVLVEKVGEVREGNVENISVGVSEEGREEVGVSSRKIKVKVERVKEVASGKRGEERWGREKQRRAGRESRGRKEGGRKGKENKDKGGESEGGCRWRKSSDGGGREREGGRKGGAGGVLCLLRDTHMHDQ